MKKKSHDIILKGELKKQYLYIIPNSCPFFNYLSKLTKIIDCQQKNFKILNFIIHMHRNIFVQQSPIFYKSLSFFIIFNHLLIYIYIYIYYLKS